MVELCYDIHEFDISLYELIEGKKKFIEAFKDREDMILYIERNYDFVKLIIN